MWEHLATYDGNTWLICEYKWTQQKSCSHQVIKLGYFKECKKHNNYIIYFQMHLTKISGSKFTCSETNEFALGFKLKKILVWKKSEIRVSPVMPPATKPKCSQKCLYPDILSAKSIPIWIRFLFSFVKCSGKNCWFLPHSFLTLLDSMGIGLLATKRMLACGATQYMW